MTRMIALVVVSLAALVFGQIAMKRAMNETRGGIVLRRFLPPFVAGLAAMTVWFFVWIGLLQGHDLSQVFPFEGLSAVMVAGAAAVFLKERLDLRAWIGMVAIAAGVALVAVS